MRGRFNPYERWLGRSPGYSPADYYDLLGLPFGEEDPQRIAEAADRLTALLQQIDPGKRRRQWKTLLDQIAQAKSCLGNPASKAAYDAAQRARVGSTNPDENGTRSPSAAQPAEVPRPLPRSGPAAADPATDIEKHEPPRGEVAAGDESVAPVVAVEVSPPPDPYSTPDEYVPAVGSGSATWEPAPPGSVSQVPGAAPGEIPMAQPLPQPAQPAELPRGSVGDDHLPEPAPVASRYTGGNTPWPMIVAAIALTAFACVLALRLGYLLLGKTIPPAQVGSGRSVAATGLDSSKPSAARKQREVSPNTPASDTTPGETTRAGADQPVSAPAAQATPTGEEPAGNAVPTGKPTIPEPPGESQPAQPATATPPESPSTPPQPLDSTNVPSPSAPAVDEHSNTGQENSADMATTSQPNRAQPTAEPEGSAPASPGQLAPAAPGTSAQREDAPAGPAAQGSEQNRPAPVDATAQAGTSGSVSPAVEKVLADARAALANQDIDTAREYLSRATAAATGEADRQAIARVNQLADYLQEFWRVMGQIVAGLESTEVIQVGDTYVAIVEASQESLTVKAAGQIRSYRLMRIPASLVIALAEKRFGKDPASKVIFGTYLATEPRGDATRARQLWQEAISAGVDVTDLLVELDQFAHGTSARGPAADSPDRTARGTPPADPKALQQVQQMFQADYQRADDPDSKFRLAGKLFEQGRNTDHPVSLRRVMLQEAIRLACEAGRALAACQAVDELARLQRLDSVGVKTSAIEQVAKTARGAEAQRELAQAALQTLPQAAGDGRTAEVETLLGVALDAARKGNNKLLLRQAQNAYRQWQAQRQSSQNR